MMNQVPLDSIHRLSQCKSLWLHDECLKQEGRWDETDTRMMVAGMLDKKGCKDQDASPEANRMKHVATILAWHGVYSWMAFGAEDTEKAKRPEDVLEKSVEN